MISFETESRGSITVLKVTGTVQSQDNKAFTARLGELRASGAQRIILDAAGLDYINSQAIGELVMFYHGLKRGGGEMALAGLQSVVEKVVRAVGLAELVAVHATVEDAERAWS